MRPCAGPQANQLAGQQVLQLECQLGVVQSGWDEAKLQLEVVLARAERLQVGEWDACGFEEGDVAAVPAAAGKLATGRPLACLHSLLMSLKAGRHWLFAS